MERNDGKSIPSVLDSFDPRCRVVCALVFAIAATSGRSFIPLVPALPFVVWFFSLGELRPLLRSLVGVNVGGALICVLLPFTYQEGGAAGARFAVLVLVKINMIAVVFYRMVVAMGLPTINDALSGLGLPLKLRVLLLLTIRHIFLLHDRVTTAARAVSLRGGKMSLAMKFESHACMVGTTLVHASDRAERSLHAIRCRGGFAGFEGVRTMRWRLRDTLLCCVFLGVLLLVAALG